MYTEHMNELQLEELQVAVEEGLLLARLALRVSSSLSELSFFVSCGLSRFYFARVVNNSFYRSVNTFCRTTSMETRTVDTERG
jgi:hypothetical protein